MLTKVTSPVALLPRLLLLSAIAGGCGGGNESPGTEEQQKDPAWVQSRIKEMDKNLIPDKVVVPRK